LTHRIAIPRRCCTIARHADDDTGTASFRFSRESLNRQKIIMNEWFVRQKAEKRNDTTTKKRLRLRR
jgi:hypothetical protein